jgi:hypothetical protein
MAAMVFDRSDQEPTCSPVKRGTYEPAIGTVKSDVGEKEDFLAEDFC